MIEPTWNQLQSVLVPNSILSQEERTMFTNIKEYHRPGSIEEAVDLLHQSANDGGRVPLAGGTHLIPDEIRNYEEVVDLQDLPMAGVEISDGTLAVGSLTKVADLQKNQRLSRNNLHVLRKAALDKASQLKRNQSTVGGELVSSQGRSELATVLIALGAELSVSGPEGKRTLPLEDLYDDEGNSTLGPAEIITSVDCSVPAEEDRLYYRRLSRTENDLSLVNFAFYGRPNGRGFERSRMAVGGVGGPNRRLPKTEAFSETLEEPEEELEDEIAHPLKEDVEPETDFRASGEYRFEVLKVFIKRALTDEEGAEDPFK